MIATVPWASTQAENLVKRCRSGQAAVTALGAVRTEIAGGSFIAVMGLCGSGKCTLPPCMAGLDTGSDRVWSGGEEITPMPGCQLTRSRRGRIGFVFRAFHLLPALPAAGTILWPPGMAGRDPGRAWLAAAVQAAGLAARLSHRPGPREPGAASPDSSRHHGRGATRSKTP
jgi:putative ABC transport system ATP-binding protein